MHLTFSSCSRSCEELLGGTWAGERNARQSAGSSSSKNGVDGWPWRRSKMLDKSLQIAVCTLNLADDHGDT